MLPPFYNFKIIFLAIDVVKSSSAHAVFLFRKYASHLDSTKTVCLFVITPPLPRDGGTA